MKTLIKGGSMLLMLVVLFSFGKQTPGISGKVTPGDAVVAVWAVKGSDSLQTAVVGGTFLIPAKAGTYRIIVDAKDPYKDVVMDNVQVKDQTVDLGEIVLQQ